MAGQARGGPGFRAVSTACPVAAVPSARDRIWGWDMLRGLCALAVALYHLLVWQDLAALHTVGRYGVYLFFVLSGASLAYTYSGRLGPWQGVPAFLAARWLRLAPLYLAVSALFIVIYSLHFGALVDQLPRRLLLNLTFAFGVQDPVVWALPVGGWSLGIEFAYYLLFPLLLAAAGLPVGRWIVLLVLCGVQATWTACTVGSAAGCAASQVAYHQVPAFGAYFYAGCLIGLFQQKTAWTLPLPAGLLAWAGTAALLWGLNPARAGDELLGIRGAVLSLACPAVVALSGLTRIPPGLQPVARWLGNLTYGTYLLHPALFFGFIWFGLPVLTSMPVTELATPLRWLLLVATLATACLAGAASERWFEGPVRRLGQQAPGRWRARRSAIQRRDIGMARHLPQASAEGHERKAGPAEVDQGGGL